MSVAADGLKYDDNGIPLTLDGRQNRGNIHQHTDNSRRINESLPWIIIAIILGALALGLVIADMVQQPQIMDAKIEASMVEVRRANEQQIAEARLAMAQQAADTRATANTGREHARVALDKVEQTQVVLGVEGYFVPSTH